MELHFFIFLATKSGPAFFQPFSHPSNHFLILPPHRTFCKRAPGPWADGASSLAVHAEAPHLKSEHRQWNTRHSPKHWGHLGLPIAPAFIFMTWIPNRLLAKTAARVGAPLLLWLYLISDSLILCHLWRVAGVQEETKWNQRKYRRRRKWSHWSPSLVAKKNPSKNQDETFGLNFFFFFFLLRLHSWVGLWIW